jgi:hypothetical protein
MRRFKGFLEVWLLAVVATAPGCGFFLPLGDSGTTNVCGAGGAGGDDGAGGDEGAGGGVYSSDVGVGAGPPTSSDVGVGAGPGTSAGIGVGAGAGSSTDVGAGAGPGSSADVGAGAGPARTPPRVQRRHGRHRGGSGIGTAVSADCRMTSFPAWTFPPLPSVIPLPAGAVPLTTTRLRAICTAQGIGAGLTGIQFSQKCGLQFQDWVQWMLQVKQNKMPIGSPARASNFVGGLPGSVIPDYVTDLKVAIQGSMTAFTLPESFFGEVKAVAGYLPPSYSRYQILGLVDVARRSAAGSSTLPNHPPPELVFTTTGNTKMSALTLGQANAWGVAIWWQIVYEDPAMPDDPNPDLCIDRALPQNQAVYPPGVTVGTYRVNSTCTKLTSAPPNWATLIPGDPDPPMVDP